MAEVLPPDPDEGSIFRCVVETIRVDGLPVVKHAWCTRVGTLIVPLGGPEAGESVFNIRPAEPHPPIPKVYKRLE